MQFDNCNSPFTAKIYSAVTVSGTKLPMPHSRFNAWVYFTQQLKILWRWTRKPSGTVSTVPDGFCLKLEILSMTVLALIQ